MITSKVSYNNETDPRYRGIHVVDRFEFRKLKLISKNQETVVPIRAPTQTYDNNIELQKNHSHDRPPVLNFDPGHASESGKIEKKKIRLETGPAKLGVRTRRTDKNRTDRRQSPVFPRRHVWNPRPRLYAHTLARRF